jgi:LysM repeat protein
MNARLESTHPRSGPTARILAAIALVAAVVLIGVIVAGSLGGSGGSSGGSTSTGGGGPAKPSHPYYVLQTGDTLGAVAHKFGISVGKLTDLNQNLDPQALPPQGCVDLVPDGCKKLAAAG